MFCIAPLILAATLAPKAPGVVNAAFEEYRNGAPVGWTLPKRAFRAAKGEGMNGSGGLVWENDDPNLYACASQSLALEPGKAYRFGAHVKAESIETSVKGKAGAFVCIEWSDAEGKWMGGSYTEHVKAPQTDWSST